MTRALKALLVTTVIAASMAIPSAASAATMGLRWAESPDRWTSVDSAYFLFESERFDTSTLLDNLVECKLDNVTQSCEDAELNGSALAEGPHSALVVIENPDTGNNERLEFNWVVTSSFGVSLAYVPQPLSNNSWASFDWDLVGDVARVECSLDDEEWRPCDTSTWEERRIRTDGEHTFEVRAFDGEDNMQAYPVSYTWTADLTAPTITHNLQSMITQPGFVYELQVDDPNASVTCRLDGIDEDCDGIDVYAPTQGEMHEITICATDDAGNERCIGDPFVVQLGASVATLTSHPPHYRTTSTGATFTFTSDPGATFECRFRAKEWSPCVSPYLVDDTYPGDNYYFEVRATKDGVTQLMPTGWWWYVGDAPFELYFNEKPDPWTSSSAANFEVDADEYNVKSLDLTCNLDNDGFEPCSWYNEFDGLAPGSHSFVVRATSPDGGSEELTYNWQIASGPGAVISWHPSAYSSTKSPTFDFSLYNFDGDDDSVQCSVDGEPWTDCTNENQHETGVLADGPHTFSVSALNELSERQDPVSTYSWTVDTADPELTVEVPATITTNPFVVPITANEPLSWAECRIDGADEWFVCRNEAKLQNLSAGIHTLEVIAWDRANNESASWSYVFDWQIPSGQPPATPTPPVDTKPLLSKLAKPKRGKFSAPWTCKDATCTVSAKIKLGRKTVKFKGQKVAPGSGKSTFKLSKSQQKWLKKKGKKKATLTVTVSGASGTTSKSLKF